MGTRERQAALEAEANRTWRPDALRELSKNVSLGRYRLPLSNNEAPASRMRLLRERTAGWGGQMEP